MTIAPFLDTDQVVRVFTDLFPSGAELHEPEFAGNEWDYVKDCLDTGWVSSVGSYVDRFEDMLQDVTGVKYAVATVNGTSALHASLLLTGTEPGDEVIAPTLTFVATVNAIAYCGAYPHFADSEAHTLGLDPVKLEAHLEDLAEIRGKGCFNKQTGRRLRAVVCTHIFGHPVDLDPLADVCRRFNLTLIEDAAESLGSLYKGRHTGNWGQIAILSFNGNKTVTTGGGGAILINDAELAAAAKHLTNTAREESSSEYAHDRVGYNYRMPNVNAAIGCAQLEQLPGFLERKRKLADIYAEVLDPIKGVTFFTEPDFAHSNYWLNAVLLDSDVSDQRDDILALCHNGGVMTRPAWRLMHRLTMFRNCPCMDLSVAENLQRRLINLPSSANLVEGI